MLSCWFRKYFIILFPLNSNFVWFGVFVFSFPKKSLVEKKGQASAPFELFVAVIVMSFVVIVGTFVLNSVWDQVCLNSVDNEMTKFKLAIEDTVAKKSNNSVSFKPDPRCFSSNTNEPTVWLEVINDKRVCAARCNYPSEECRVITYNNPKISNAFKQKCLDLPIYTNITMSDCHDSTTSESYEPINPAFATGGLRAGTYIIKNVSAIGDQYPKICGLYLPS